MSVILGFVLWQVVYLLTSTYDQTYPKMVLPKYLLKTKWLEKSNGSKLNIDGNAGLFGSFSFKWFELPISAEEIAKCPPNWLECPDQSGSKL